MVGRGGPDVTDGVTDRCVDGERPVAEDTHHRGNHDSVDDTSALRRRRRDVCWLPLLRRSAVLSDAFWMREKGQCWSTHRHIATH